MRQPSEPNDFIQPSSARSNSSNRWVWIAAGSGCGCLGLIILGFISAITIPSFVNGTEKAKQAEAKVYVGIVNQAQSAYRRKKPTFTNSFQNLGVGIKSETTNYSYKIIPQTDNSRSVMVTAQAKNPHLKSYTGAVFAIVKGQEIIPVKVICESEVPTRLPPTMPAPPKDEKTPIQCPSGSQVFRTE